MGRFHRFGSFHRNSASRAEILQAQTLIDQKKGIPVHGLGVIAKDLDRVPDLSDRRKDIDRHRLGSGPCKRFGLLHSLSYTRTGGTEITGVHEQEKSLVIPGKEDLALQFQ